jgi:hypothetical protein
VFTDDRQALLRAISRPDDPLSATELHDSTNETPNLRERLSRPLALARQLAAHATQALRQPAAPSLKLERELDHDR